MTTSLLLLFKFGYDIAKRLIQDAYFRALGIVLLLMVLIGALFFWLVEGDSFFHAIVFSAMTLAMNSPYGIGWGPHSTGGIIFFIVYTFLGVGLFLLFVLEAGKTMVQSYEQLLKNLAERKAVKYAKKQAAMEERHEQARRASMKRIVAATGLGLGLILVNSLSAAGDGVVAPGAKVQKLAGDFEFTEGPTCDAQGNVFLPTSPMIAS
jgi:hypothetical protein